MDLFVFVLSKLKVVKKLMPCQLRCIFLALLNGKGELNSHLDWDFQVYMRRYLKRTRNSMDQVKLQCAHSLIKRARRGYRSIMLIKCNN